MLSRGGNQYASLMLGLGVADSTAGYRVYSKKGLELIDFETVSADGYGFQIEMTYRAKRAGASMIEVPISFTDRELGESKNVAGHRRRGPVARDQVALERPFARRSLNGVDEDRRKEAGQFGLGLLAFGNGSTHSRCRRRPTPRTAHP